MAQLQRQCDNHPDRRAIGVCVITGKAICGECSTRYEGVNYSRQGLAILQAQRAREARGGGSGRVWAAAALLSSPVLVYLLFLFYRVSFELLIDLQQIPLDA